ncbi:hypothetical protein EJ04DRAFT_517195 [Polyplosphaeria fusca]|uniref:Uncharacterized protein n=1 Tax=Polyplosphaeria fusca TaxID=682080 RepID=A0A9P4QM95_9PLEO|nr:hypothetical protein EJ04DRAFT_517195 [Polyplosphaeria fusca]
MHVVQYQRNEYGVGNEYAFDVVIFDNAKKQIGKVQKVAVDSSTKALSVSSELPYMVVVVADGNDEAPVKFSYGGQAWQNDDASHQSTLGTGAENGYESGNRKGDMGFNC